MVGDVSETSGTADSADGGLSEIALHLHEAGDTDETIDLIAEFSRSALAGDDAGVLIVRSRSRLEIAASTGDTATRAHLLQVELDEGPCLDAIEARSTIYRIDDARTDDRWPRWGAEVVKLGYRSVLSAPLATRDRHYGSINVYAARVDAFDEDDEAVAMILARHASVALATSHNLEGLRRAIDARKLIGIAMGMLMERYSIDSEQAFDVLRRYSQTHNTKLRDVAEQVVTERGLPPA